MNPEEKDDRLLDNKGERLWRELQAITRQCDNIERKLDQHQKFLTGNGEPGKGLVVRVENLEKENKRWADRSKWAFRTAVMALVTIAVSAVSAALSGWVG